jgi:GT2 family glycosyltransferase
MACSAGEESTVVDVSVIVNVRERFEYTDESLRSLHETADLDFELVYVDVKSPRKHAEYLREQAEKRNFRLVRVNRYISPNMARNIGVRHATGKYLIFVDNDVIFQPGWMSALVDCAKETDAWAVGPLYMHQDGYHGQPAVHMAAGDMTFSGNWGERDFNQVQRHFNRPLSEVPEENLVRQTSDLIEFHCALIRRDVFEKVGTLDEELLTTREHLDFCLRILGAGGTIYFEPKSVINYLTPPPLMTTDLPYFCLRWSDQWTRHTLQHFASKWGITPSYDARVMKTRARRQRLMFTPIEKTLENVVGQRAASLVTWPLKRAEPVLNNALVLALNSGRNSYATKVIHD